MSEHPPTRRCGVGRSGLADRAPGIKWRVAVRDDVCRAPPSPCIPTNLGTSAENHRGRVEGVRAVAALRADGDCHGVLASLSTVPS